ncbi:unnamed protein product [Urochloa humidicola]
MAGAVPGIVVLALGAGALGGPDALRFLIAFAGRNPVLDIGICLFVFAIFTVLLLGNLQLVRFVRKPPPAGGADGARRVAPRAPATDYFARITLLMSLAAASLVTACLVLVAGDPGSVVRPLVDIAATYCYPTVIAAAGGALALLYATPLLRRVREQRNVRGGAARAERAATTWQEARFICVADACALLVAAGLGSLSLLIDFAAKNSIVAVIVIVIGGATAAGSLFRTMHPLRVFRDKRNAQGRAARPGRATTTHHAARFIGLPLAGAGAAVVCAFVVGIPSGLRGGLLALCTSPVFISMAVAVVVGAALLVSFYRRARNAAGGGATPAPAAGSAR